MTNPFHEGHEKPKAQDDWFSHEEVRLANRNSGILLESLGADVTPLGLHYLLNHFDVPMLNRDGHVLSFEGAFDSPYSLTMDEIEALPRVDRPVTLECAGNGRTHSLPRSYSMPWGYEAVGTYCWTGTPLAPLIERAGPRDSVREFAFFGADYGYDSGHGHCFGRSLTVDQLAELDALLVWGANGQPLLPQHGAPLRIIVPGWYGMASVKWLTRIEALETAFDGFQQVRTYRFRDHAEDPGRPITEMRVKSLMAPPGVPDWVSRKRLVQPGPVEIRGRAWSGGGRRIVKVELGCGDHWQAAEVEPAERYAWAGWSCTWDAVPGTHLLRCRATDEDGRVQPVESVWDYSGFANNAAQIVEVVVPEA